MLDAHIGGGLANPKFYYYNSGAASYYKRALDISTEIGLKLSLTNK